MKFVISLAFQPLENLVELARAAEEAGFEAVAFSDHVVYPETLDTPYPYTEDGSRRYDETSPFPDPWVAIGALASVTTRLRFTNNVFVLGMRNPFLAAKAIATAAALSNDRVTLTIGVGWSNVEFDLVGQSFRNRGRRTDEMIEVMRKLWTGEFVEHHGEFYDFAPLSMQPVPRGRIPIWVGGISARALARAARNDGWISDLQPTSDIVESIEKIQKWRAEQGNTAAFDVMASASDAHDVAGYQALGQAGVTHILTMPWAFYHGLTDDLEKQCDGIRRYAADVIERMG
jgi:probable F420-dependent oxidoreductase